MEVSHASNQFSCLLKKLLEKKEDSSGLVLLICCEHSKVKIHTLPTTLRYFESYQHFKAKISGLKHVESSWADLMKITCPAGQNKTYHTLFSHEVQLTFSVTQSLTSPHPTLGGFPQDTYV